MNAIFFGLKRAFHGTLRITRRTLTRMGLTAARFDMLSAIDDGGPYMTQRRLRRALGVTRATVSRMVRSLEALGWVLRRRDAADGRTHSVKLTKAGRKALRRASAFFVDQGAAQLAVDSALGGRRWFDTDRTCFREMDRLQGLLWAIRRTFGDTATLTHPWHPDD